MKRAFSILLMFVATMLALPVQALRQSTYIRPALQPPLLDKHRLGEMAFAHSRQLKQMVCISGVYYIISHKIK